MPQDNIALRSQEFGLAANESVEPARAAMQQSIQHFTGTLMQGAQMAQQNAQQNRAFGLQQQEQDVRKEVAVSSIALDRVRKQQALEELNWSRELHTTAMLENQRRVSTAQADLMVAEAEEKKRNLGMAKTQPDRLEAHQINSIIAQGSVWDPQSGAIRAATPAEVSEAQKWLDQEDSMRSSVIERNKAAAEAAKRMQQAAAAHGTVQIQALREEVTTLLAQQEALKHMPAVTDAEKKAKAARTEEINKSLKDVQGRLRALGESGATGAPTTPAATQDTEDMSDTALFDMFKSLMTPEPKK